MASNIYHLDKKDKSSIPSLKRKLESAGNKVVITKTERGYSIKVTSLK